MGVVIILNVAFLIWAQLLCHFEKKKLGASTDKLIEMKVEDRVDAVLFGRIPKARDNVNYLLSNGDGVFFVLVDTATEETQNACCRNMCGDRCDQFCGSGCYVLCGEHCDDYCRGHRYCAGFCNACDRIFCQICCCMDSYRTTEDQRRGDDEDDENFDDLSLEELNDEFERRPCEGESKEPR